MLWVCFGKPITDNKDKLFGSPEQPVCLQWYSPATFVQVATADNREIRCHVVFEMELTMKQNAGQRDVDNKVLLMDEVSGFHHLILVFHTPHVSFSEENGLQCTDATLLVTWQMRPGLLAFAHSVAGVQRKLLFMSADTVDLMNSGHLLDDVVMQPCKRVTLACD